MARSARLGRFRFYGRKGLHAPYGIGDANPYPRGIFAERGSRIARLWVDGALQGAGRHGANAAMLDA